MTDKIDVVPGDIRAASISVIPQDVDSNLEEQQNKQSNINVDSNSQDFIGKSSERPSNVDTNVNASSQTDDKNDESTVYKFELKDHDVYDYLTKSSVFANQVEQHKSEMSLKVKREENCTVVSGSKTTIEKIKQQAGQIEEEFRRADPVVQGRKVCRFHLGPEGNPLIKECASQNDVIIHRKVIFGCCLHRITRTDECSAYPNKTFSQKITWSTKHGKSLYFVQGGENLKTSLDVTTEIVTLSFHVHSLDGKIITDAKTENGLVISVTVSSWYKDNKNYFAEVWKSLLSFIENKNEKYTVIIPLQTQEGWDTIEFTETVISWAVEVTLDVNVVFVQSICLVTDGSGTLTFERVAKYTQRTMKSLIEAEERMKTRLKILVVDGELSKAKVDVVVNTTSRNLDLSNGKVSSTLLKAGGSEIQNECKQNYPSGIMNLMVAVTGGHKLPCKKVFHVALDRYDVEKSNESVDSIRNLVYMCLDKANSCDFKTIAFPALGTGILRYPPEIVAAAMFEGVERFRAEFRETSLEEVQFVVFHGDKVVMERCRELQDWLSGDIQQSKYLDFYKYMEFKKHEEFLGSPLEHTGSKATPTVEFKIFGPPTQVQNVLQILMNKSDELEHDPEQIQTTDIHNVIKHDFLGLTAVFSADIDSLKRAGVDLLFENNSLRLKGKRRLLTKAEHVIKAKLHDMSLMKNVTVSVPHDKLSTIEREIKVLKQNQPSVNIVFDRYSSLVYIYSAHANILRQTAKLLNDKLKE